MVRYNKRRRALLLTVGPSHSANKKLAAWGPSGRLTRFWGGEEQNHYNNAQAHHETKDKLSKFVSHKHHSPHFDFARGLWANRLLCNNAPSVPPGWWAFLLYVLCRFLSNYRVKQGSSFSVPFSFKKKERPPSEGRGLGRSPNRRGRPRGSTAQVFRRPVL